MGVAAVVAGLALLVLLLAGRGETLANTGSMSPGHQELACAECHMGVGMNSAAMNGACLDCHVDDVGAANHAHSPAYFEIVPQISDMPWYLSPADCVDCHRGHTSIPPDPDVTTFAPRRFCVACHGDLKGMVGPHSGFDHTGMTDFNMCAGCHQFHSTTLSPPEERARQLKRAGF